eukprot:Clim_evm3s197 gene=Clim_evmTU3s197
MAASTVGRRTISSQIRHFPVRSMATQQGVKTAVILMNLGGPATQEEVHDFLLRLFSDKDLIPLPAQEYLSKYIAWRRTPMIQKQYAEIGGGSPIKYWTELQGKGMCEVLDKISPATAPHKPYIAFRYAKPLTEDCLDELAKDKPERVVAFTQYPQYSCSTTGSSLNEMWRRLRERPELSQGMNWSVLDRWPTQEGFVRANVENIKKALEQFPEGGERDSAVILFTAHSLPMSVVNRGDPYPQEVAASVQRVMEGLNFSNPYRLVWQSKVGPQEWLGAQTEDALEGLHRNGRNNVVLVPIAFTSDHIETLFELDLEYIQDGREKGMNIVRTESMNDNPVFINAMADMVKAHLDRSEKCSKQMLLRCPGCINETCGDAKQFFLQQSASSGA